MTRAGLIEELAARLMMPQREAETLVQTIFDAMAAALARGEKVELRGFGSFRVRRRRPRVGYNPKTGTRDVTVPAKRVPFFRAGRELKRVIFTNRPPAT